MTDRLRVLIVEDHRSYADLLAEHLSRLPDVEVIGIARMSREALAIAAASQPDVVLLDEHLPDARGTRIVHDIKRASPETVVVLLTGDESDETLLAAAEGGADGYLVKSGRAAEIVAAVRRVAAGEASFGADALARLLRARDERAPGEGMRPRLTEREREVLALLDQGSDNAAVAERLAISVNTVRRHVQAILDKLGAHSKLEAVATARRLGLLD